MMRFPSIFVNHGGGPLPLLGKQPALVDHMRQLREQLFLDRKPSSIVVVSAHWESDPVRITSAARPPMLFDYYGFPPESYKYDYPASGNPALAARIQSLLSDGGIPSELDAERGFDHGVFIPLMLMFPEADVPVVSVSLHAGLDADTHLALGRALAPLREEGVLLLGSGYTFHNLPAFFNPTPATVQASRHFDGWLRSTLLDAAVAPAARVAALARWAAAPGARVAHPREEHLLPLLVVAAAGGAPRLVFEAPGPAAAASCAAGASTGQLDDHAVSGYLFE